MQYEVKEEGDFRYIETGGGTTTLLLLHGLFGSLSNFNGILEHFGPTHNVIIPMLPIFELPLRKAGLGGLVKHIEAFVEFKNLTDMHVVGNSLGGHIAQVYALNNQERVASITLTASSGLFENSLGSTFPKRGNYEFIENRTRATFYDPNRATKAMIDEIFEVVNDRAKTLSIIATAKSALRHNLADKLHQITVPVLLVWGADDTITPPFVGEKFHELLVNSQLHTLEKCGHAPMMEHPDTFNQLLEQFLTEITEPVSDNE